MGTLPATHDGTLKLLAMPGVTFSNLSMITEALYLNPVACRTSRQLGKDLEQRFEHVLRTIQLDLAAGGVRSVAHCACANVVARGCCAAPRVPREVHRGAR